MASQMDRARAAVPAPVKHLLRPAAAAWRRRRARRHAAAVSAQYPVLPRTIRDHYRDTRDPEIREVLGFLATSDVQMLPYDWVAEYDPQAVPVRLDACGLWVADIGPAPVYFPSGMTRSEVAASVANALAEQDPRSPHRYSCGRGRLQHGAAALVGASDGMYALEIVELVERLYLFEADAVWTQALHHTLEPWREKVVIVPKMVGDTDGDDGVTLDGFFAREGVDPGYVQADVEGGEVALLQGMTRILSSSPDIALSLCCYHRQTDQVTLMRRLQEAGLSVHSTRGYMILWPQLLAPPYLRRGVLHATKALTPGA